jgi:hypothetical protein
MKPLTREAYGGGMYGTEEGGRRDPARPRASATQSADGPEEQRAPRRPSHPPPPSTGDRDLDVTGHLHPVVAAFAAVPSAALGACTFWCFFLVPLVYLVLYVHAKLYTSPCYDVQYKLR